LVNVHFTALPDLSSSVSKKYEPEQDDKYGCNSSFAAAQTKKPSGTNLTAPKLLQ
jgi:hypothetical protein